MTEDGRMFGMQRKGEGEKIKNTEETDGRKGRNGSDADLADVDVYGFDGGVAG